MPEDEQRLVGTFEVEATAMAIVRQRFQCTLPYPMLPAEAKRYIAELADSREWDYHGINDSSVEVSLRPVRPSSVAPSI